MTTPAIPSPIRRDIVDMNTSSAPIAALTVTGLLLVVLGLLVAGSIALVLTGVGALVAGGIIGALSAPRA